MINHKGKGEKEGIFRGGVHNSDSFANGPGALDPKHRAADVPKWETKQIMG